MALSPADQNSHASQFHMAMGAHGLVRLFRVHLRDMSAKTIAAHVSLLAKVQFPNPTLKVSSANVSPPLCLPTHRSRLT